MWLLLLALVAVAGYVIWPRSVIPVQFISVVETGYPQLDPNSAAAADARRLQSLFQNLHSRSADRVAEPIAADLSSVGSAVSDIPAGCRLVVYCSAHAVPVQDRDALALQLLSADGQHDLRLLDFLDLLAEASASHVVLLLDMSQTRPALDNGLLANDQQALLKQMLQEDSNYRGLTIICSAADGERNWPYPAGAAESSTAADETDTGLFSGTVFGQAIADAFAGGRAETVQDLAESLQQAAQDPKFGDPQTLPRFDGRSRNGNIRLLAKMVRPATVSEAETDDGNAGSETGNENQTATATDTGDAVAVRQPTQQEKLKALWQTRDELREQGLAAAVAWQDWVSLQPLLVQAETALRHGDSDSFGFYHDEAQSTIRSLENRIAAAATTDRSQELTAWIPVAEPVSTADESTAAPDPPPEPDLRTILESVADAEPGARVPEAADFAGDAANRRRFVDWLLNRHLPQLAVIYDQLPPEGRNEILPRLHRFLLNLDRAASWRPGDWPHSLVTLKELLPQLPNSGAAIDVMARILSTRRQALQLAVGIGPDGQPIRRVVWQTLESGIDEVLRQTTAAERWLAVGSEGLTLAERRLSEAQRILSDTISAAEQQQQTLAVLDARQAELQGMLELLARHQERVPLTATELTSARQIVESGPGDRIHAESFPQAVLNATGLRNIHDDLISLTSTTDVAAADQAQRFQRLQQFINSRLQNLAVDPTDAAGQLDALAVAWMSSAQRKTLEQSLQRLAAPAADSSAATGRTGLWLSFWSIRTLSTLGLPDSREADLWAKWSQLVASVVAEADAAEPGLTAVQARIQLGSELKSAWDELLNRSAGRESGSTSRGSATVAGQTGSDSVELRLLPTEADYRPLVIRDLQRHAAFAGEYAVRLRQLSAEEPAIAESAFTDVADKLLTSADGSLTLPVGELDKGQSLAVFSQQLRPAGAMRDAEDGRWMTVKAPADDPVQLTVTGTRQLQEPASVILVRVDSDGIPREIQRSVVYPPTDPTLWTVAFYLKGQRVLSRFGGNGKRIELELPPLTPAKEPLPLSVRLVRPPGDITPEAHVRIHVRLPDGSQQEIDSARVVSFQDSDEAEIPLLPTVADPPAAAPADGGKRSFDISYGIRFTVTPQSPAGPQSEVDINVRPDLYGAAQYLERPEPTYDLSKLQLTLPLRPRSASSASGQADALRPDKLPVHVHFDQALQNVVQSGFDGVDDLQTDLDAQISFRSGIEQLLRDGSQELQFSISAAGVPAAWRWRLNRAGNPELLEGSPTLHAGVSLANPSEVPNAWRGHELLLSAADFQKAKFAAEFEIHGGNPVLEGDTQYLIELEVIQDESPRTQFAPIRLSGQRLTHTEIMPGENNQWLFATSTTLPRIDPLPLQGRLNQGRYRIRATLRRSDQPAQELDRDEVPLTIDESAPEPARISVTAKRHDVDQPLNVSVAVRDPESGLLRVEAGFTEDDLQEIPLGLTPDTFQPEAQGEFMIPEARLKSLVPLPAAQQREPEVKFPRLIVRTTNRIGLTTETQETVELFRKPSPQNRPEENRPGTIIVTFNNRNAFKVTLTGPTPGEGTKGVGPGKSVTFPNLEPGRYQLKFENRSFPGRNPDAQTITLGSGQTRTVPVN